MAEVVDVRARVLAANEQAAAKLRSRSLVPRES